MTSATHTRTSAITPQEALQRVIEHREIFHDEMLHIMRLIMSGEMSPVLMSAFITASVSYTHLTLPTICSV